mmetsp:Transcript_11844/g.15483  ORF Transcript_11844/g.15483 Transcript_11844/m.15483 type:complete len:364 (+) Transcript_11844:88-1179(+)|eukprot:CAMPEP_0117753096 /NCGR_PEP_ID=MMETSP0947-20121206/12016_1 /TAXON_ID=44440 /ORGANISM="Chattonella subsalsa, Strain CCMP2191" /LENGTH=363 /DNA_ID=CAMNT_0005571901 /DNA_START=88 /DNA_END=1179 /DNA_ORIENTATION=+
MDWCLKRKRNKAYIWPDEEKDSPKNPENPSIISRKIDDELQRDLEESQSLVKVLLLGAENAGKSTVLKQLRHSYGKPQSMEERRALVPSIHRQILEGLQTLNQPTSDDSNPTCDAGRRISNIDVSTCIDHKLGDLILQVWQDNSKIWQNKHVDIYDTISYFLENLDRVKHPRYIPSYLDLLYLRIPTFGVHRTTFVASGTALEVYDVGGQRSERRKWIHCFDNVNAIIFIAAINEYDQYFVRDGKKYNRLAESLQLFREICENEYLQNCSIILYLNKIDLFQERVLQSSISCSPEFADFQGKNDAKLGVKYFTYLFLRCNRNKDRTIYGHLTCALDTDAMSKILQACIQQILESSLKATGILF